MGLKDWLAGSVVGPSGFGDTMGPQVREAGSALANAVFLSHGRRSEKGPATVFDTLSDMGSAGLKPRYAPLAKVELSSLTVDEERLLTNLTVCLISYVWVVNSNAALQVMRRDNTSKFRNGLGYSLKKSMVDCGLFVNLKAAEDALRSNVQSMGSVSVVLNETKPASGDLLEYFIIRSVEVSGVAGQYGFVRTGLTGFDVVAVPIFDESLAAIFRATKKYQW
jgi:hypothetical protein